MNTQRGRRILITGIPCAGKTEMGSHLAEHGFVHLDAEEFIKTGRAYEFPGRVEAALDAGSDVVVTWGFWPGKDNEYIRAVQQSGFKIDDPPLATPIAETPTGWVALGFHESLDEASAIALDAMLNLMMRRHGLTRKDSLALASVVVDLRVTQMANGVWGVHALLPPDAIR